VPNVLQCNIKISRKLRRLIVCVFKVRGYTCAKKNKLEFVHIFKKIEYVYRTHDTQFKHVETRYSVNF